MRDKKRPLDEFTLDEIIEAVLATDDGIARFVRRAFDHRGVTLNTIVENEDVKKYLVFTNPNHLELALTEEGSFVVLDACGNYVAL